MSIQRHLQKQRSVPSFDVMDGALIIPDDEIVESNARIRVPCSKSISLGGNANGSNFVSSDLERKGEITAIFYKG